MSYRIPGDSPRGRTNILSCKTKAQPFFPAPVLMINPASILPLLAYLAAFDYRDKHLD
jgi:hypothetical protein